MEGDTFAELEGVLGRITIHRPLFSQLRMQAHVVPDLYETVMNGALPNVVNG